MEKLKMPSAVSPPSPRGSGTPALLRTGPLPRISNRSTDVEIPRDVWSPWIPDAGARKITRPLTPGERQALEARRDELAPLADPYRPGETHAIAIALAEMFSGFTSMRQGAEEAVAKIESICHLLEEFPAWAILKACTGIRKNGVWRNGKFDKQWPPNDSELFDAVRQEARLYADQHRSAVALLAATVEER